MPKVNDVPQNVRPFQFHGLLLAARGGQWWGECPFCQDPVNKFAVSEETSQWDCKNGCQRAGNAHSFVKQYYEHCRQHTDADAVAELAELKGLDPDALDAWGVAKSTLTGEWLVPAYGAKYQDGDGPQQLYRYIAYHTPHGAQYRLLPTPGLFGDGDNHRLFGRHLVGEGCSHVHVCEGPWDGVALWHALGGLEAARREGVGVVAVPGAGVFLNAWLPLFKGKEVVLLYDNDHPRTDRGGVTHPGAGLSGAKRAAGMLKGAGVKPLVLFWGKHLEPAQQHDADLPDGYDVRDLLAAPEIVAKGPDAGVDWLREHLVPAPAEWPTFSQGRSAVEDLVPQACHGYGQLMDAWHKAMKMTSGLDRGLSFGLSVVLSTDLVGSSQLWGILESPASTGKSTLADGMAVSKKYVKKVSNLTGLLSGYKSDKEGSEDFSLVAQIAGKTMVIKEADTLLKNPMRDTIMAQMRDLYDGTTNAHYKNGINRDYTQRTTVLMCGTGAIRALDSTELGSRYLTCSIMRGIDRELEDAVLDMVLKRAAANIRQSPNCTAESKMSRDLAHASRLTGGYVEYLRAEGTRLTERVGVEHHQIDRCKVYARFVSYMRARPSKSQSEVHEREFPARLTEQFFNLMMCTAAVMNKPYVDDEVMRRVAQVAVDSGWGTNFKLVKYLYEQGDRVGAPEESLRALPGMAPAKLSELLGFLREIEAVERFSYQVRGATAQLRWRVHPVLSALYRDVVLEGG